MNKFFDSFARSFILIIGIVLSVLGIISFLDTNSLLNTYVFNQRPLPNAGKILVSSQVDSWGSYIADFFYFSGVNTIGSMYRSLTATRIISVVVAIVGILFGYFSFSRGNNKSRSEKTTG